MSSLYIARIHRPWAPRLVGDIACPSLHSAMDWQLFHVKHVGPGGSSSRAHNALNERLLVGRLGILVNDDANGFVVDYVVDAADVAATCHEVNDIGA